MNNINDFSVKVTSLVENKSKFSCLSPEHGLSFLVECGGKHIFFDTGASSLVVKNAENMAINIDNIDHVVLSHGHYDHTGGLEYIENKKVYVHPDIFLPKYDKKNDQYKYTGMPYDRNHYLKENKIEFIEIVESRSLTKEIKLHANFKKQKGNNHYLKIDDNYFCDLFSEELVLSINTCKGLVIITGCSHSGIINIIEKVIRDTKTNNIYALLGGFHLLDLSEEETKQMADEINNYSIDNIGISHCTGDKLEKYLNGKVFNFNTGDCFTCPDIRENGG